ncbi:MAG: glutamine synthetase type III, partial [Rhodothermales bacterium]|nr:glutamine synthetase type III [Rhodothermales bacterium]
DAAEEVGEALDGFRKAIKALVKQNKDEGGESVHEKAEHMHKNVLPAMAAVREAADDLERIIPADEWPLPSYQEILFVK